MVASHNDPSIPFHQASYRSMEGMAILYIFIPLYRESQVLVLLHSIRAVKS